MERLLDFGRECRGQGLHEGGLPNPRKADEENVEVHLGQLKSRLAKLLMHSKAGAPGPPNLVLIEFEDTAVGVVGVVDAEV